MPKPEPTWTQKAQQCKAELDGCHDQLERFKGIEQMLREANERIRGMEQASPDLSALPKQIEFWKREAQTAQQRESNLQGRVQRLENALREAPTKEMVDTVSVELELTQERYRQAAQQAEEARRQAAGLATRVQQLQAATEAVGRMEQAVDQWQRKATVLARENSQLRQEVSALPELRAELAHKDAGFREIETRLRQVEPLAVQLEQAARALPTVRADLAQKTEALEQAQRRAQQLEQALDQAQIDREELATLRRSSAHQVQRLFEAGTELERKQRELAASNAEVRRLTTKLNDARTNLG